MIPSPNPCSTRAAQLIILPVGTSHLAVLEGFHPLLPPAAAWPQVTLVCAGNRRKEENMHKKSIGFNWGPCAVSTSHWTGVRMSELLRRAGVKEGAGYVCFRGPKAELPKGDDGSYGEHEAWL